MGSFSKRRTYFLAFLISTLLVLVSGVSFATLHQASAQVASAVIQQISNDPFTNSTSQHHTQVEPDTFASGSTVVSAFQSGRFYAGGGSSGISWATSTNAGLTWQGGTLPGITVFAGGGHCPGRGSPLFSAYAPRDSGIALRAGRAKFGGGEGRSGGC